MCKNPRPFYACVLKFLTAYCLFSGMTGSHFSTLGSAMFVNTVVLECALGSAMLITTGCTYDHVTFGTISVFVILLCYSLIKQSEKQKLI